MEQSQQEKALKEARVLKNRVDVLEKENMALKRSLYELSAKYNSQAHKHKPFSLADGVDGVFGEGTPDFPAESSLMGDGRGRFHLKHDLKGHTAAVYAVQWAPSGRFLASGSFDKTVRIWDPAGQGKEVHVLSNHNLNISDLGWSYDSSVLLSGAYDQTCCTWNVQTGQCLQSYPVDGFVQVVMFHPFDTNVFFCGTSRNLLSMTDTRAGPEGSMHIKNDCMINSLWAFSNGTTVLTADHLGFLKYWDVRTGKLLAALLNEPTKKPLSHVSMKFPAPSAAVSSASSVMASVNPTGAGGTGASPNAVAGSSNSSSSAGPPGPGMEPTLMAVNSYDNVLRVYDRVHPPTGDSKLLYALKGHKNKNWPIKSSFYNGPAVRSSAPHMMTGEALPALSSGTPPDDVLLATGSADPFVYLYNLSDGGQGQLAQRLEGHTDRVYAVHFHPVERLLASCSADGSVKCWHSSA